MQMNNINYNIMNDENIYRNIIHLTINNYFNILLYILP
jgi:hypothetical protein